MVKLEIAIASWDADLHGISARTRSKLAKTRYDLLSRT